MERMELSMSAMMVGGRMFSRFDWQLLLALLPRLRSSTEPPALFGMVEMLGPSALLTGSGIFLWPLVCLHCIFAGEDFEVGRLDGTSAAPDDLTRLSSISEGGWMPLSVEEAMEPAM